jgi:hypothetical protein
MAPIDDLETHILQFLYDSECYPRGTTTHGTDEIFHCTILMNRMTPLAAIFRVEPLQNGPGQRLVCGFYCSIPEEVTAPLTIQARLSQTSLSRGLVEYIRQSLVALETEPTLVCQHPTTHDYCPRSLLSPVRLVLHTNTRK